MTSAFIFVCSDKVDPYVNVMSYLQDKRKVDRFIFVFVTGATIEGPKTAYVDTLVEAVENLAHGRYSGRYIELDSGSQSRYSKLVWTLKGARPVETVQMEGLAELLERRRGEAKRQEIIVDVTGLPKILMAQVLLICIVEGYPVYTFELRHRVDGEHPEFSLYHALPPGDFSYHSLARDLAVQTSVRKLVHIRKVSGVVAITMGIGFACFVALWMIDSTNVIFLVLGLIANIVGIGSAVLQLLATRNVS